MLENRNNSVHVCVDGHAARRADLVVFASMRRFAVVATLLALVVFTAVGCGDEGGVTGSGDVGANQVDNDGQITGDLGTLDAGTNDEDADSPNDTTATPDSGTSTTDATDVDTTGAGADVAVDVGPDTSGLICPGGAGCDCAAANDCDQGVCLDTADGKKCAQTCTQSCPGGFTCKKVGDGDPVFVCVANFVTICSPCSAHSDCNSINVGTLCLEYGAQGKFCGGLCKADADCPTSYSCVDTPDKDTGKISKQCRLKSVDKGGSGTICADDGDCSNGETCTGKQCSLVVTPMCPCSKWAKVFGKTTTCSNSNDAGTCSGKRTCLDKGMSDCSAKEPAVETCNAVDDDCDGVTDKLPGSVTCTVASYLNSGSKTACAKDADCAVAGEGCGKSGECRTIIGSCPGTPTCGAKGALLCTNAKTAVPESCNGLDDDCDSLVDEDFGWKDATSDKILAVGDACGTGACSGGKIACESLIKATCTTIDKVAKESCDDKDNDCNGKTDDLACDDGNECTTDSCDGKSGTCANKPGADCDDKNPCTADSCNTKTGTCENVFATGSCDDGDACTVGDSCSEKAGKSGCSPGSTTKSCDDSNVCTDDTCDGKTGCINLANAVTQTCFSGSNKQLDVGTCKAGVRYCSKGVLATKCDGEVVANSSEACDAKDDDCDGKTDEGCAAGSAEFSLATTSGRMTGGKGSKSVYVHIDGDGPVGRATGKKNTIWSGFIAWLVGAGGG